MAAIDGLSDALLGVFGCAWAFRISGNCSGHRLSTARCFATKVCAGPFLGTRVVVGIALTKVLGPLPKKLGVGL